MFGWIEFYKTTWLYRYVKQEIYIHFLKKIVDEKYEFAIKEGRFKAVGKFKNVHKDERCFIVGTGPSLKHTDLSVLKNEYTFGVNALCLNFPNMGFVTNYFVISDFKAFDKLHKIVETYDLDFFVCCDVPESEKYYRVLTRKDNNYIMDYNNHSFCNDISKGVGNGNTVILQAIQIAAFMGFKEIYLLGVDCNYNLPDKEKYFIDHGIRNKFFKNNGCAMIDDFKKIKQYEEQWNIKIYNASIGGKLEVFPRVKLKDVFQEKEK